MTREESIQILKLMLELFTLAEDEKEAIRAGIEALEQEPFINKPCVSEKVCEHDKNYVLDKIRAEITAIDITGQVDEHAMFIRTGVEVKKMTLDIIDKYKTESEEQA